MLHTFFAAAFALATGFLFAILLSGVVSSDLLSDPVSTATASDAGFADAFALADAFFPAFLRVCDRLCCFGDHGLMALGAMVQTQLDTTVLGQGNAHVNGVKFIHVCHCISHRLHIAYIVYASV